MTHDDFDETVLVDMKKLLKVECEIKDVILNNSTGDFCQGLALVIPGNMAMVVFPDGFLTLYRTVPLNEDGTGDAGEEDGTLYVYDVPLLQLELADPSYRQALAARFRRWGLARKQN